MLPKIPPGHSPEIVMLLVFLLNWKSMWTPLYVLFEVFEAQMD